MDINLYFGYFLLSFFGFKLTFQDVLPDPIGFWPFNKLSGIDDVGLYRLNATEHGLKLTSGRKGKPNTAYQFSETSHSALHIWHGSSPLRDLESFTILLLIKPDEHPYPMPIWTWRTTSRRVGCILQIDRNGSLAFTGEGKDGVNRTVNGTMPVAAGEWQVMFLSYMGKNGVVNMKLRSSDGSWIDFPKKTGFKLPISTWGDMILGATIFGHNYFTGAVDCLLLFDEALHKHEVGTAMKLCQKEDEKLGIVTSEKPTTTTETSTGLPTTTTTTEPTIVTPKTTEKPKSEYVTAPYKRTELICDDDAVKNAEWAYSNKSGNCYRLFNEQKTFDDAKAACLTIGGSFAVIKYEEEQLFLNAVLEKDWIDHWVYGTRVVGQNFTWGATNDKMTYYNFLADKQPTDSHTCLLMTKNYVPPSGAYAMFAKWNSADCNTKQNYICQKTAKRCPELPKADHTVPKPPSPYIELTIKYECAPGYELPDYAARYKDWQAKSAAQNPAKQNITGNSTASTTTTITTTPPATPTTSPNDSSLVEPTIKTNPTMEYLCEFPGNWTIGSIAPCEPISCVEPPKRPHTTLNSTNRVYPSYIEYKCDHGYLYNEYNTTTMTAWCGPDKQWIDVPKECDTVECGEFPIVFNATANAKLNHFKDTVVWQCNEGFMFPDGSVRQWVGCRENYVNNLIGRWNVSKLDDCERLSCPPLPSPAFTTRDSNDTAYNTIVTYSCISEDYEFPDGQPMQLVRCSEEAQWKPKVPACTKKPSKLETKGKKYVPQPIEAASAESIGYSALIFVVIFLILIFLLDLTTIWKDIRMLKYNCRHFMKRVNSNKTVKRADLQPIPKDLKDQ